MYHTPTTGIACSPHPTEKLVGVMLECCTAQEAVQWSLLTTGIAAYMDPTRISPPTPQPALPLAPSRTACLDKLITLKPNIAGMACLNEQAVASPPAAAAVSLLASILHLPNKYNNSKCRSGQAQWMGYSTKVGHPAAADPASAFAVVFPPRKTLAALAASSSPLATEAGHRH